MLKIVKNNGQCKTFRSKWLFYTDDFCGKSLYAKPSLKSLYGYVLAKIKRF